MKLLKQTKLPLIAGAGLICAMLAHATPANAQAVACPVGYGYSYGYGCVPVSPGYQAVYAPPARVYQPPIFDPLVIAFGGGDHGHGRGHWHGDHGHDPHGHDDHGHH